MNPSRRELLGTGARAGLATAAATAWPWLSGCGAGAPWRWGQALPPHITGAWVGGSMARGHAWRDQASLRSPPAVGAPVRTVHTLVVGAGVAGLAAAQRLASQGLDDVVVLDLDDRPGGNAKGHVVQGLPCPLGAHYLPVPAASDAAHAGLSAWLQVQGLIHWRHGRWVGDERHLCHSPQERLFLPDGALPSGAWRGHWQEGLLPFEGLSAAEQGQVRRFESTVQALGASLGFAMPTHQQPWTTGHAALDGLSFAQWLDAQGFTAPALRWWLDYACRDDYGASLQAVSAWAGIQYVASRHMRIDGDSHEGDGVLTWPDGNAELVRRLAAPLGDRVRTGQAVVQVQAERHGVTVWVWSAQRQALEPWQAQQVVMAVPLWVAARMVRNPVSALQAVQPWLHQAPWLVTQVLLAQAPVARAGAPLSWDNVFYSDQGAADQRMPSLGYVNARHQALAPPTGPTLLTHYWALGGDSPQQARQARQALAQAGWAEWAARVLADLVQVHPELPEQVLQMDLMRWGHGMVIPVPGLRGHAALRALVSGVPEAPRLHWAHSDLSAFSVFEEAFAHGQRAADQVLQASGKPRSRA